MASKFASKGLRPYKTGSNIGYESNCDRLAREKKERETRGQLTEEEMAKKASAATQFKGFVGGKQFRTKLGFQGNAFDTLWGKHVFLSFANDDEELFEVAMQSELADVKERVIGGEFGSAFFIGDIGFFSQNQFELAAQKMRDFEISATKGTYFLSTKEWVTVNANIKKLADYSQTRATRAVRGTYRMYRDIARDRCVRCTSDSPHRPQPLAHKLTVSSPSSSISPQPHQTHR